MDTITLIRNLLLIGVLMGVGFSGLAFWKLYEQRPANRKNVNILKMSNPKQLRHFGIVSLAATLVLIVIVMLIW
jgi:hypothetical protein